MGLKLTYQVNHHISIMFMCAIVISMILHHAHHFAQANRAHLGQLVRQMVC